MLPKEMANKSGFEEDFIREVCFSKPLKKKVEELEKEGNEITKGTDNFLAMVDDLASVSKIIKTVTKIRIPHKDYNFVPFELAVGVDEIKNQEVDDINRKEVLDFYKNDIVGSYRKYYKSEHNSDSVKQTFVVHTDKFYKELELKSRHLLSRKIQFDSREFFLGDLDVMQDIESAIHDDKMNVEKFKISITNEANRWKHFEVKAFLFRSLNNDKWKVEFLYA